MRNMVEFSHLEGISNVALLLSLIIPVASLVILNVLNGHNLSIIYHLFFVCLLLTDILKLMISLAYDKLSINV